MENSHASPGLLKPVSYTHLDVYKRQVFFHAIRYKPYDYEDKEINYFTSVLLPVVDEPLDLFYSVLTVSYTHLDVYKRQIFPLPVQKGMAETKLPCTGRRGRKSPAAFPL